MPAWVVPAAQGAGEPLGGARPRARCAARGDDPGHAAAARAGLDLPGAELPQRRGRAGRAPTAATPSGCRSGATSRPPIALRRRPRRPRGAARGVVDGRGDRAAAARPLTAVGLVSRVVLDAPGHRLGRRARPPRAAGTACPAHVGSLARAMMRRRWGHRLVGVHEGVDLAKTDWVRRADELHHPMLLIHRADDEFVPCGPVARAGAGAARPGDVRGVARRPALQGVEHRARALGAARRRVRRRLSR